MGISKEQSNTIEELFDLINDDLSTAQANIDNAVGSLIELKDIVENL